VVKNMEKISSVVKEFIKFLQGIHRATIESSVSSLELECTELEFALLTMLLGSLVGIVPMPTILTIKLLPYFKDELKLLELRSIRGSNDVLSDLMSSLGGEW